MKKGIIWALLLCLLLGGCANTQKAQQSEGIVITDSMGKEITVNENPKVACLYGSYAEAWLLAGGELAGVTKDAVDERELSLGEDVSILGTVKEPNTEEIIALDPELVILSADIAAQEDIRDVLENAGLNCAYFRVDTFDDYAGMMEEFAKITGREDLFNENVTKVQEQIEAAKLKAADGGTTPEVLLIRAFSTGIKAKTDEELAGVILKELGCKNIAEEHPSMLEELSLEEVIAADPDFIFVTTMGDETKALSYFEETTKANPAWRELSAVREEKCIVLPKELFHYKPNNRWGESYEYLGKVLYPDIF